VNLLQTGGTQIKSVINYFIDHEHLKSPFLLAMKDKQDRNFNFLLTPSLVEAACCHKQQIKNCSLMANTASRANILFQPGKNGN